MMRVIVEIHPRGVSQLRRTIATIDIANISELAPLSDYQVRADVEGQKRQGLVFAHNRDDGWAPLVRRAIDAVTRSEGGGT